MPALRENALYYGDCLDWMRQWPEASVDLIYLDPPFNSNADYNVIFGRGGEGVSAQVRGFADTWKWDDDAVRRLQHIAGAVDNPLHDVMPLFERALGPSGMLAYLAYMGERLVAMQRLLKREDANRTSVRGGGGIPAPSTCTAMTPPSTT